MATTPFWGLNVLTCEECGEMFPIEQRIAEGSLRETLCPLCGEGILVDTDQHSIVGASPAESLAANLSHTISIFLALQIKKC